MSNPNRADWPHIQIYTDGGADPNPGPGGWGVILIHPAKTRELSGSEPHTTNNRMELTAAIEALKALTRPCVIDLYTDSEYLQKGITQWVKNWIDRGHFEPDSTKRPANADLWAQLIELTDQHDIHWHWVKGHAGNEWNERADQLASAAIPGRITADVSNFARLVLAVSNQGGKFFYAASVVHGDDTDLLHGAFENITINQGSLRAAIAVLEWLSPNLPVVFFSNNSFLIDGITQWIIGWKKKGFKKFESDWRRLDELASARQIKWVLFKEDKDDDIPAELEELRAVLRRLRNTDDTET